MRPLHLAALLAVVIGTAVAGVARAAPYPVHVAIQDEEDIEQLLRDGDIDEPTRDRLLTLFYARVDPNAATADELYELPGVTRRLADAVVTWRQQHGPFHAVDDLLRVPGFTDDIMEQARPFLRLAPATAPPLIGDVRAGAIGRIGPQRDPPTVYLRARVGFLEHAGAGVLLAVRPMNGLVGDARAGWYCNTSGSTCGYGRGLTAAPEAMRFDPASAYAYWDGGRLAIIGGSYRIGYGLGLTLDNTNRRLPHGWYANTDYTITDESGKVTPFEGFLGLAARLKQVNVGPGWFDLTAFVSAAPRDIYNADLDYDRGYTCPPGVTCDTSRLGKTCDLRNPCHPRGTPAAARLLTCSRGVCVRKRFTKLANETPVFDATEGRDEYRSLFFDFPTLRWIMLELMGGANATYWFNRRARVGLTGYAAHWRMTADAPGFRPANASKYPNDRQTWGAVGVFGQYGRGNYEVAGEVSVTDQGKPAALVKAWLEPLPDLEIIPSIRYYSVGYDNPYNRGEANADEYLGNRARDELGGRVQVTYKPWSRLKLRADADFWYHRFPAFRLDPTLTSADLTRQEALDKLRGITSGADPAVDMELTFRADLRPTSREKVQVWLTYHDEDLSRGGRGLAYTNVTSGTSAAALRGGARLSWAVTASTKRIPRVTVTAQFKQIFEDTRHLTDRFDHSWYAWLRVAADLAPGPRLDARFKYFDEFTPGVPRRTATQAGTTSRCDAWAGLATADLPDRLPGICRGETFIDLYVQATQRITFAPLEGSAVRARFGWTHWRDNRFRWRDGATYGGRPFKRDEFVVRGYFLAKF